jgi:hypothetical protein
MGLRHITGPQINRHPVVTGLRHHLADLLIGQFNPSLIVRLHGPKAGEGFESLCHLVSLQ